MNSNNMQNQYAPSEQRKQLLETGRRDLRRLYAKQVRLIKEYALEIAGAGIFMERIMIIAPQILMLDKKIEMYRKKVKDDIDPSELISLACLLDRQVRQKLEGGEGEKGNDEFADPSLLMLPPRILLRGLEKANENMKAWKRRIYGGYRRNLQNLLSAVQHPERESFVPREIREDLVESLQRYSEALPAENDEISAREQIETFKGALGERATTFLRDLGNYSKALEQHKPSLSQKKLQAIAAQMNDNLEARMRRDNLEKQAYASTQEGRMLRYAFYLEEVRRIKEEEQEDNGRKFHLSELEENMDFLLEGIKSAAPEESARLLEILKEKGHLDERMEGFIAAIVAKAHEQPEEPAEKHDEEDRQLCQGWMQEMYNLSEEKISELLKYVTSEDITRIENALDVATGAAHIRMSLIRENPSLLIMGERDTLRYIQALQQVTGKCQPYTYHAFSDRAYARFDINQSPVRFASLSAIARTQKALEEMINGNQEQVQQDISELEKIKRDLQEEDFDPKQVFQVVHGFWFKGQYHSGSHRMKEEKLRENIRRREGEIDERIFVKTLKRLKGEGVIIEKDGVLSLNVHPSRISLSRLRDAVKYIKAHPPTEEERENA